MFGKRKMSFFKKLKISLTDFNSYRYYLEESIGRTVVYVMILTLIFGTFAVMRSTYDLNRQLSALNSEILSKLSDFSFKNGVLEAKGNMPLVADTGHEVMVLDTTGKTDDEAINAYENGILITKHKLLYKNGPVKTAIEYKFLDFINISKQDIDISASLKFLVGNRMVMEYLSFFIGSLLSAVIIAFFGIMINSTLRIYLTFGNLFKLSVYSLTLPIILDALLKTAGIIIPFFTFIYYGVACLYLRLGINSMIKNDSSPL